MADCRDWTKTQMFASYKGVRFEVDSDAREFGRRNALHLYPNSENYDIEDMGIAPKHLHVIGFVGGDDADFKVAQLEAACSDPGPGLLVLPNRPAVLAAANPCVSNWEADRQGTYTVQLEFTQKPFSLLIGLISVVFLAGAVTASVSVGAAGVQSLFSLRFDSVMRRFSPAVFVPPVAREAAAETIGMAADALERARKSVVVIDSRAGAEIEILIRQLKTDRRILAYQGQRPDRIEAEVFVADQENIKSGLAGTIGTVFDKLATASTSPPAMVAAMATLSTFVAQDIDNPFNAHSVRAEIALTGEVAALVRRMALLYMADAMAKVTYVSRADAVTARADLSVAFETEAETIDDIDAEEAFLKVRDDTATFLSATAAELPALVFIDSPKPMPAAVLATLLYNDASRAIELAQRNHARDPLFMPLHIEAIAPKRGRRGL